MPFGIVTQTKPGYIKAEIPELEDYETDWIPVISPLAKTNKSVFNLPKNSQVFVIFEKDEYGEIKNAICLGATYNETSEPDFSSTKDGVKYADTSEISYDQSSKILKLKSSSHTILEGILVEIGKNPNQNLVSMATLNAYLILANTAIAKIPAVAAAPADIAALNAALLIFQQGVPSVKTPIL